MLGGDNISNLEFNLRDLIHVDNDLYRIISIVSLIEDKGKKKYNIYKLEGTKDYKIRYIYINSREKFNMLLTEYPFNNFFNKTKLLNDGYEKNIGQSMVIESRGDIDYYLLDNIDYTIYSKDEDIVLIQKSKKNTKYLKGKKIDREEFSLKRHDREFLQLELENKVIYNEEENKNSKNKKIAIIVSIIAFLIIIIFIFAMRNSTSLISNNISQNSELTHLTSIISNEKKSEEAKVYESDLKATEVADILIKENKEEIIDVIKNKTESVIVIITNDEYCTVYTGDEYKVFVQVSSREYVYFSGNGLYRPAFMDDDKFYRDVYYKNCFDKDKELFSGKSYFVDYNKKLQ